jgi:adenosine deaminase
MPLLRVAAALLAASWLAACAAGTAPAPDAAEAAAAARFEALKASPPELVAFLREMPKGGDLHSHLSGAIYAESYIAWAAEDGICVNRVTFFLVAPPCDAAAGVPAVADTLSDETFQFRLIDALSVRNYAVYPRSGHDQFFATFAMFGAAGDNRGGDMLAEVMARAADQNILYLELMTSPGMSAARHLAADLPWHGTEGLADLRNALPDSALDAIVARTTAEMDDAEADARAILDCDGVHPPACDVTVRYLAQVIRIFPPQQVFAQTLYGFRLVEGDPRFVGINFVAPEDDHVTLRDYRAQMAMVGFASGEMPDVPIALHAGELTLGLVPPEDLRFHIRDAVTVAGADRIGHGVDLMYEDDPYGLMAEMAARDVAVEINLTSNDVILGVVGDDHPFEIYRAHGVPVLLSTDDEGVSRIDLTHEYARAVETYDLTYADVKALSFNSLRYAFAGNRDDLLADLQARFDAFEADVLEAR